MSALAEILIEPQQIDEVFCKIITSNDDSGRHGVLIPTGAYEMFPDIEGFDPVARVNYNEPIKTLWREGGSILAKRSYYKHYHRYPERRITSLSSRKLDLAPPNAAVLVARRRDDHRTFEVHVFYPEDSQYMALLSELGISHIKPGIYYLDKAYSASTKRVDESEALEELLSMFDSIRGKGFVRTLRPGPTGIGYTFETLMGIKENNDAWADFKGIEIKTFRSAELKMMKAEKTNLFLKEPRWTDGLPDMVSRVRRYGYIDDAGRYALYSTVKIDENSHHLKLAVAGSQAKLEIERLSVPVAFYKYDDINKRLTEKHNETAFVAAKSRGKAAGEEFHYQMLTYCTGPSLAAFMSLIQSGSILLELRMHISSAGAVRNHGSAFRIMKDKLPALFSVVRCLRD